MKNELLFEKVINYWLAAAVIISAVMSLCLVFPVFVGEKIYNAYASQKQPVKDALFAVFMVALICAAMIFLPILSQP